MVDIQSEAAEIRRVKKERKKERKKTETTRQKYNGLPITQGGHNEQQKYVVSSEQHT